MYSSAIRSTPFPTHPQFPYLSPINPKSVTRLAKHILAPTKRYKPSPQVLGSSRFASGGIDSEGRYIRQQTIVEATPEEFEGPTPAPSNFQGQNHVLQRGLKSYELTNHLGNVMATVSDRKRQSALSITALPIELGNECFPSIIGPLLPASAKFFLPDVRSVSDYEPFGSPMPGRQFSSSSYRYGFSGKEKDDEIKGTGNSIDFGDRMYDSRLNIWLSVDKLAHVKPFISPYSFALNNPIRYMDPDGNFEIDAALADKYKNLKPALENIRNKIASLPEDHKLLASLKENSGLTREEIVYMLTDGKGPKLTEKDLVKFVYKPLGNEGLKTLTTEPGKDLPSGDNEPANGRTLNGFLGAKIEGEDEYYTGGEVQIDDQILELTNEDKSFGEKDKNEALEIFESVILHEATHVGDNGRKARGKGERQNTRDNEVGKKYEKGAYGKDLSIQDAKSSKIRARAAQSSKKNNGVK